MARWEYRVIDSKDLPRQVVKTGAKESIEEYLNELGDVGWEVVNIDFRELEGRMSFVGVAKRERRAARTVSTAMRAAGVGE